jgi:lipopolysaccharide transport system ATP-binding protein
MNDYAIQVENLGKQYRVGQYVGYRTLRESLSNLLSATFRHSNNGHRRNKDQEYIWPLKDISFSVKRGEAIGIIGRNGAGKTTLLKVLSRITEPTEGRAFIRGRVGSLLEVGTGFHPELTGRENVYLNGAVLGMKKREIDRKFDEIVEFSGVKAFVDTPLKRFSSGMQVRLAFAVAAHLEPEILLVDEVLAVGDMEFQKKCLGKMEEVSGGGKTVLFVSHNMGLIGALCERTILLDAGRIVMDGETGAVISKYIGGLPFSASEREFPDAGKDFQIQRVAVMDAGGNLKTHFDVFEQVVVEIDYEVKSELSGSVVATTIYRQGILLFISFDTDSNNKLLGTRPPGRYRTWVKLPCPLKAGNYTIGASTVLASKTGIHDIKEALCFDVEELSYNPTFMSYAMKRGGVIATSLNWTTKILS